MTRTPLPISAATTRRAGIALLAAFAAIVTSSCSATATPTAPPAATTAPGSATRTFTDAAGTAVTIPDTAQRVGLPFPYNTSDAILLGACDRIAATRVYSQKQTWVTTFCPSITGRAAPYESPTAWNIEEVIGAKVDLQFAPSGDDTDVRALGAAGIPSVVLPDFSTLKGLRDAVGFEGAALGGDAPARAKAYQDYLDAKLAMVTAVTSTIPATQRPSVLAVDSAAGGVIHVLGAGTIMNEWIGIAGGTNAAQSITGMAPAEVSVEQILQWNPDVIVVGLPTDKQAITSDPRLRGVKAVADGKVLLNPAGTIIWMYYGSEEALNIQWAAKQLHPDLFPTLDIAAVTTDFYKQFFGYQLSSSDLDGILVPKA